MCAPGCFSSLRFPSLILIRSHGQGFSGRRGLTLHSDCRSQKYVGGVRGVESTVGLELTVCAPLSD